MNKIWSDIAWDEYLYWQMMDKKTVKKIKQETLQHGRCRADVDCLHVPSGSFMYILINAVQ